MPLPDGLRLGAVRLQVADLGRSVGYYERVIGLRTVTRSAGRAILAAQGDDAPLIELHERAGAAPVPRRGRLGLYHFAILLPDRAALGRFVRHLADHDLRAGMSDHLVSEAVYLTDPDGLGIEVYADRARSEWPRAGGALVMAVDPLNVESLLQAAGNEPWTGAPAGTVIGHLHLHVGDLSGADAFYHRALGFEPTATIPGALFLSAGGYHHHLGNNTWSSGPSASDGDARLLEWTIVLPDASDVADVARSLRAAGYEAQEAEGEVVAADPWGTSLRLTVNE